MTKPKIARPLALTEEETAAAVSALSGFVGAGTGRIVLDVVVAAVNALRRRCPAETATGRCLYGLHPDTSGHHNGIASWHE